MKTRIIKRKGTLLSSVAMLSTAMLLTACGGDGGDSPVDDGGANPGESGAQALLYAYPDNGQGEISTAAPVVLRFSSAVNLGQAMNSITLYEGDAETGTVVETTPESVAKEPNNVLLQPYEDLKPNQIYTVVIEDMRLRKGTAKDQTLTFTTRPLHEGPKSLVVKEDTFEVSRRMPDGSAMEPVMDFSSFRFQFTQPVDRATADYGDSVTLTSSGGDVVDATLLIDGAYMTVDPEPEYLNAGETYTLDITADLTSTYGEAFGAQSYSFTPKDSSPKGEPAILVQKLTQGTTSRLTGKPVNEVPVNGTLLGENDNITQASAEVVRAELADVTTYTDVTPIRLPKGTILNGAEINPILIGGEVPAGFGSGDVTMTVLSDASGYLVPNPYAGNNPNALRIVHLMMDVGIATSEARANGAFTQDLLHIELVGLAEVDPTAGVLNLDAVSVVEPNILGQEYGYGMLSFQLQSYKDQTDQPSPIADTMPPSLQSWMPGPGVARAFESGEPIVLNFDKPLDAKTVSADKISLTENGVEIGFSLEKKGSALVIRPSFALNTGSSTQSYDYQVHVLPGISDVAGNNIPATSLPPFWLPQKAETATESRYTRSGLQEEYGIDVSRSPILLSVYPGFPCALDASTTDLSNDIAGRCAGAFPGLYEGTELDQQKADDLVPVMSLAANKPIIVQVSKELEKSSIVLGGSFLVEEIDDDGNVLSEVPGSIQTSGKTIKFFPENSWAEDTLYRYVMKSNGDMSSSVCTGNAICDRQGFPLQTQLYSIEMAETPFPGTARGWEVTYNNVPDTGGGPDFIQYFKGGSPNKKVIQTLVSESLDNNANMLHDKPDEVTDQPHSVVPMQGSFYYRSYDVEETGAENQPRIEDVSSDEYPGSLLEEWDPNGLVPPKNSAKILSSRYDRPQFTDLINGVNVGCGYQEIVNDPEYQDVGGRFVPFECPEQKFTYLTSSLVAEVSDEYVDGKGIKVEIWPGQILATSVNIRIRSGVNNTFASTGPQLMRLRYDKTDPACEEVADPKEKCERTKPITAWITTGDNNKPVLTAEVDVYLDAMYLSDGIINALGLTSASHDLLSFPLHLSLTGEIAFNEDGSMSIQQYNTNTLDLTANVYTFGNILGVPELFIPAYGSRLEYVSKVRH